MNKSGSIKEIAGAMAKAQAKILNAEKAAENPGFKRGNQAAKYADLTAIWDACREQLTSNGVAVIQSPSTDGNVVSVTTLLIHSSGEWIESDPMRATAQGPDAQKIGSATTYLRRYSLAAMVGVAPANEDDDGNKASGVQAEAGRPANGHAKPSEVARLEAAKVYVLKLHGGSGSAAKAAIEKCIGRTFGDKPVAGLTEQELANLEAWVELSKAAQNKEREGAQA